MNQIFKDFLRQANTCLEFLPESFFWEVVDKCIPRDMEIPEELRALNGYKKGEHIDLDKVLEDAMDGQIPAQVFLAVLIFCSHGNILRLLPLIFRLLKKGLALRDPKARAVLSGCLFYLDQAPDSEFAKLQQLLHEFKAKDAQLVQEREVSLENAAKNAANS